MSDYDAGGYEGGGSQEVRMEMQELHVEFTGDGRILLEVKGVKVRSGRDGFMTTGYTTRRRSNFQKHLWYFLEMAKISHFQQSPQFHCKGTATFFRPRNPSREFSIVTVHPCDR